MARPRYDSAVVATLIALRDRLVPEKERSLGAADRLDGCTALVTGANRGLGRAIAVGLGERGARVLLACRGDASEALAEVRRATEAEAVRVDLADLESVDRLADALDQPVHALVLNAGVVPSRSRTTAQGLELQLGVNYLANVRLVDGLLERGRLTKSGGRLPRIIAVSSESHRSPRSFEISRLGVPDTYGVGGVMRRYGESKLLLTTWTEELARRLAGDAAVHTICPGPVATGIASEAPRWSQPLLEPVIRTFFAAPAAAAKPITYLACARELEGESGLYFHRWRRKPPAELALDRAFAAELWEESHRVIEAALTAHGRSRS